MITFHMAPTVFKHSPLQPMNKSKFFPTGRSARAVLFFYGLD